MAISFRLLSLFLVSCGLQAQERINVAGDYYGSMTTSCQVIEFSLPGRTFTRTCEAAVEIRPPMQDEFNAREENPFHLFIRMHPAVRDPAQNMGSLTIVSATLQPLVRLPYPQRPGMHVVQ